MLSKKNPILDKSGLIWFCYGDIAMKKRWQMVADPKRCTLCYMCQLVCSLKQDKIFNPSQASIKISRVVKPSGELDVGVSFNDNCDSCGLCAKYCLYDALARKRLPAAHVELQAVGEL